MSNKSKSLLTSKHKISFGTKCNEESDNRLAIVLSQPATWRGSSSRSYTNGPLLAWLGGKDSDSSGRIGRVLDCEDEPLGLCNSWLHVGQR